MKFNILPYQLFVFIFAFIIFTVIGTVSHEYGHIVVAEFLGHETQLHYGSMNWDNSSWEEVNRIYYEFEQEINADLDFEKKKEFDNLFRKINEEAFWITLGGPLQTMLTGIIGLLILFFRRKNIRDNGMMFFDWLAVFLSLFWLREVFNLLHGLIDVIFGNDDGAFGGDEAVLSYHLNLWEGTIPILFGFLGLLVSIIVIFRIIPVEKRFTFILAGLIGGIAGFILWLDLLGPIILP